MTGRPNKVRKRPPGLPRQLHAKRESLGVTQQEAADMVGISVRTWNRYESGRTKPSRLALRELEKFLKKKS
jgi:transcriptional regulator with XRE-family HTH domain